MSTQYKFFAILIKRKVRKRSFWWLVHYNREFSFPFLSFSLLLFLFLFLRKKRKRNEGTKVFKVGKIFFSQKKRKWTKKRLYKNNSNCYYKIGCNKLHPKLIKSKPIRMIYFLQILNHSLISLRLGLLLRISVCHELVFARCWSVKSVYPSACSFLLQVRLLSYHFLAKAFWYLFLLSYLNIDIYGSVL